MEFINPEGLRIDGRRPKELRRLKCELGTLANANGSASFEIGHTKVSTLPRLMKSGLLDMA
jgi:exosome complex component RRP41